jgi:hypothetical protein
VKKRIVWAALPLIALATAASAQLAPGVSGISGAPTTASEEEYWFFIRELGRCLALSKPAQSLALMNTSPGSAEEKRAFDALVSRRGANNCMRNYVRARMLREQVRGSVAEGLYKARASAASQAALQPIARPSSIRSLHDFAACYVAAHPANAQRLLNDTKLGTKDEHQRVRDLAATFGPCLPQGREVRIVPVDIRLALAEALYRTSASAPAEGIAK